MADEEKKFEEGKDGNDVKVEEEVKETEADASEKSETKEPETKETDKEVSEKSESKEADTKEADTKETEADTSQKEEEDEKEEELEGENKAVVTEYEPFDAGKFLSPDTEEMLQRNEKNAEAALKAVLGEEANLKGRITRDKKNRFVEARLDSGKVKFHGNLTEYRASRIGKKDKEALKKDMEIIVEKYKKDGMDVLHINGKEEFRKLFREVCDEKGMKWVDKAYDDDNKRIEKDLVSRYGKDEESKEEVLKELDEKYGVIANENDVEKAGGAEKFFEQYRGEYLNMADAKQKFDKASEEDLVINTDGNQNTVSNENVETNAPEEEKEGINKEEKPLVETKLNSLENADDKKIVFANDEIELTQKDLLMYDNLEKTRQAFDKFSDVSKEARDKVVNDVLEAYNALNERLPVKVLDDLNDKDNASDDAILFREALEKEVKGKASKPKKKLFENIAKKFSEKAEQFRAPKKEKEAKESPVAENKVEPEVKTEESKVEQPIAESEVKNTQGQEVKETAEPQNQEEAKKKNIFNKAFDKFKRQGR